jgi:lipoate-protein ligase A
VTVRSGSAAELHALEPADDGSRQAWVLEPDRPALVLGSTQADAVADARALTARDVALVRRRSGGGAVLVEPGRTLWVDLVVPRTDPLWVDDVTTSFRWLGHAWRRALAARGIMADVHGGAFERTPWSRLVCFAGVGSGEVLTGGRAGGRKIVGLSQRRTRSVARFQSVVYLGSAAVDGVVDLLAEPADPAERAALLTWLRERTAAVAAGRDELLAALLASLPAPR